MLTKYQPILLNFVDRNQDLFYLSICSTTSEYIVSNQNIRTDAPKFINQASLFTFLSFYMNSSVTISSTLFLFLLSANPTSVKTGSGQRRPTQPTPGQPIPPQQSPFRARPGHTSTHQPTAAQATRCLTKPVQDTPGKSRPSNASSGQYRLEHASKHPTPAHVSTRCSTLPHACTNQLQLSHASTGKTTTIPHATSGHTCETRRT